MGSVSKVPKVSAHESKLFSSFIAVRITQICSSADNEDITIRVI